MYHLIIIKKATENTIIVTVGHFILRDQYLEFSLINFSVELSRICSFTTISPTGVISKQPGILLNIKGYGQNFREENTFTL